MASITLAKVNFPVGTVLTVYSAEGWVVGQQPSGTSIDSSTVDSTNGVTFDGLTEGRQYVAWSTTQLRGLRFRMDPQISSDLRPNGSTKERLEALEQQLTAGGGGGGGGSGLPSGGSVGQAVINTGPGAGSWQTLPVVAADLTAEADARAEGDFNLDARVDTLESSNFATSAALTSHQADSTAVHGVANMARLMAANVYTGSSYNTRSDQDVEFFIGTATPPTSSPDAEEGDLWLDLAG